MQITVFDDFTLHSEDFKPEWLKKSIYNAFEMLSEYHPGVERMETPAISLLMILGYIVYIAGFRRFEWDTIGQSPFIPTVHQHIAMTYMGDRYMLETFYRIRRELIKLAVEGEISIFARKIRPDGIQEYTHIN